MPIVLLWNALAMPRAAQFGRWLDSFVRSNLLLERWLKQRTSETGRLERMTRAFPVFQFCDDAITAQVTALQAGALLAAPVSGVGAHLERALGRWNVARTVKARIRENDLLPELLRVLDELTDGVLKSVRRFETPEAKMFDVTQRRAQDLPGLTALAWRALGDGRGGILDVAKQVKDALDAPLARVDSGAAGATGAGATLDRTTTSVSSPLPLAFQIDSIGRYLMAAMLVIPALASLLPSMGRDALLHLRLFALDFMLDIERSVFALRRTILMVFVFDLDRVARQALVYVLTMRELVVAHVSVYVTVGLEYLKGLMNGVATFSTQMQTAWGGVATLIKSVVTYGEAVVGVNIGFVLHNAFDTIEEAIETIETHMMDSSKDRTEYEAPNSYPVTIGELVMQRGNGARAVAELAKAVGLLVSAWGGVNSISRGIVGAVVHKASGHHIGAYMVAMKKLSAALQLPRAGVQAQPSLVFDSSTLPDVKSMLLDPLRTDLNSALTGAVFGVQKGIDGMVTTATSALERAALSFEEAAARSATFGGMTLMRRILKGSDALVLSMLPAQSTNETPAGLVELAGTYASGLIQGGFDSIGAGMAGFVSLVLQEWLLYQQEGNDTPFDVTPISPRKLLQRSKLGRVHTKEVRIVVPAAPLGQPLAARVADGFQRAVQGAYATGTTRFGERLEASK